MRQILSFGDLNGRQALDVGFGDGQFLLYFHLLGACAHGLEWDDSSIAGAGERLPFARVMKGDVADLPREIRFDVIVMNNVLEHPFNPADVLHAAVDRLSPGGILGVAVPNASFAGEEREPEVFRIKLEKLQFFSLQTARFLSDELKLELVHLECYGSAFLNAPPPTWRRLAKKLLNATPGYALVQRARRRLSADRMRWGRDFLFFMLRKPILSTGE